MNLQTLLKGLTTDCSFTHQEVTNIFCDSRQVTPGSLFFAIPGTTRDGTQFMVAAAKRGAVAIVHQGSATPNVDIPAIRVNDCRQVLAEVASRFYKTPSEKLYLCGLTGTNGKTTITYLLEKIWQPDNAGVIGTINARFGNHVEPATTTTPDPITIQRLLADMVQAGTHHAAIEVSSHGLSQKRAHTCAFDAAVLTNLTQDHLDYHKDMESYYQAKKILFAELLAQSHKQSKLAVINADDDSGIRLTKELSGLGLPIQTFSSLNRKSSAHVVTAQYSLAGINATLSVEGIPITIETPLLGIHNLKNIMAATLVGLHSGSKPSSITESLATAQVPGRLERIGKRNIFVDYAHTPDALANVLSCLKTTMTPGTKGRLFVVFGCGGDRDAQKRPIMGEVAARLATVVIVTSDNPRTEDPDKIISQILPGVTGAKTPFDGTQGFLLEPDRKAALKKAFDLLLPEDALIVAGKGHEDYQIIGTEKKHFDDREILREMI